MLTATKKTGNELLQSLRQATDIWQQMRTNCKQGADQNLKNKYRSEIVDN